MYTTFSAKNSSTALGAAILHADVLIENPVTFNVKLAKLVFNPVEHHPGSNHQEEAPADFFSRQDLTQLVILKAMLLLVHLDPLFGQAGEPVRIFF